MNRKNRLILFLTAVMLVLFGFGFLNYEGLFFTMIIIVGYKLTDYYVISILITLLCVVTLPILGFFSTSALEYWGYIVFYLFVISAIASTRHILNNRK